MGWFLQPQSPEEADVPAEEGSVSITPESSQACLPLDLIPSLATLKTANGTNLFQTHAPMSVL